MALTLAHITPIRGVNDEGKGKKHALHRLIHASEADVLWLHDDDVLLPEASDAEALQLFGDVDLMILPLRMQAAHNTLIERLQVIEYTALQALTIRAAMGSRAVMCSGANLLVRRSVWLEAEPHLHPELPGGDDMFLLEYCKRTGKRITVSGEDTPLRDVCGNPERFTAVVTAQPTLRALLRQRMRWAGKAPHYTDNDIRLYGATVAAAMVLQLLCPPLVLLYLPFECELIRGKGFAWYEVLLLALVYPYYALISLIGGLLNPQRW